MSYVPFYLHQSFGCTLFLPSHKEKVRKDYANAAVEMAMTFVNHILYENWSPALVSDWIKGIEYMSCLWSRIPFIFDSYVRPTGAFWKTWNHTPGFPCTLSDSGNFNYKSANTTLSFNQDDIFFTHFLLFEWGYLSQLTAGHVWFDRMMIWCFMPSSKYFTGWFDGYMVVQIIMMSRKAILNFYFDAFLPR